MIDSGLARVKGTLPGRPSAQQPSGGCPGQTGFGIRSTSMWPARFMARARSLGAVRLVGALRPDRHRAVHDLPEALVVARFDEVDHIGTTTHSRRNRDFFTSSELRQMRRAEVLQVPPARLHAAYATVGHLQDRGRDGGDASGGGGGCPSLSATIARIVIDKHDCWALRSGEEADDASGQLSRGRVSAEGRGL